MFIGPIGNHTESQTPRYGVVGNGNEMNTQRRIYASRSYVLWVDSKD